MPAANHAGIEPVANAVPHRIVAVLMTGHDHTRVGARCVGNAMRLRARQRHGLLAQHVVALLDRPHREVEMRCRWRADVHEFERAGVAQCIARREMGHALHRNRLAPAVDRRDDLQSRSDERIAREAW